jgi:D-amino-acid dehydrogenase
MKIVVIGSGLIGVTTAYFLSCRGHEVTVIDREEGVGREASFANGALLTPSMSDPWNAPGCWRVLLASLVRSDSPLQLRLRALPALADWGIGFLRNSSPAAFKRNSSSNLRLALYSLEVMRELRQQTRIGYDRSARGSLRLFRDHSPFDHASAAATRLISEGLTSRCLSSAETVALEPALAAIGSQLVGAIHYENDEIGDAYVFCEVLADLARQRGVEFRFGVEVSSLEVRSAHVLAVLSRQERFVADQYVVAAGSHSTPLLRDAGITLPVRPAKGYSVTFTRPQQGTPLSIPVLDDAFHAVVSPLGNVLRVAGTAEFAGYDQTIDPVRIQNLGRLLRSVLPDAQIELDQGVPWCGLRPMSVDGVPIIGDTPIANLKISTGHGHLGWTMAAGSAQLLTDLICDEPPALDPRPFALTRFAAGIQNAS